MLKPFIFLFFFCLSFMVCSQNLGFINSDSLLQSFPEYKQNIAQLDSLNKSYSLDVKMLNQKLENDLQQLLESYDIDFSQSSQEDIKSRLSASDQSKFDLLIEERQIIDLKRKNLSSRLEAFYNEKLQPFFDTINTTIEDYAVANKLDLVLDYRKISDMAVYYNKDKNITGEILKKLHPKK